MKAIPIFLIIASLVVSVDARPGGGGRRGGNGGQTKEEKEEKKKEEAEKKERERKRQAVQDYLRKKDTNKDGSLSRDEFLTDESDKASTGKKFDQYNKNRDRSLSKSEIEELLGL
jgi:hypothetical protein